VAWTALDAAGDVAGQEELRPTLPDLARARRSVMPLERLPDLSNLLPGRSESQERLDEQIDGNGRVRRLHLGESRLARPEALRRLRLRPPLLHAHVTQEAGEGKLELDERLLLGGEFEEILGVTDAPAGTFEAILLVLIHLSSLSLADDIVVLAESPLAGFDHVFGRRLRLLLEHFRDHDRVVIDPIDDPPGGILVHDS
jgi:hypothetical protein